MSRPAKKAPAKKAPAKKAPAKKAPAKKAPAKKAPAKKAPAKKAPAKPSAVGSMGEGAGKAPPRDADERGPASGPSWSDLGWDDDAWDPSVPTDDREGPDERGWWGSAGAPSDRVELLQAAARDAVVAARALLDVAEELIDDPAALGAAVASLRSVAGGFLRGTAGREHQPRRRDAGNADPEGYERIDLD